MSRAFNMYPMLSPKQMDEMGYFPSKVEFFYQENYDEYQLSLENTEGDNEYFCAELKDPRCVWYPETHNLVLRKTLRILNAEGLFGKQGIAPISSNIGIAILWISKDSEHRGVIQCGEVKADSKNITFNVESTFEKSLLKGSLILETVLFLKSLESIRSNEEHLAQQTGTILGVLESAEIYIDGNGSVFPISTVNDPSKPLWWVYYDEFCDPLEDPFNDEHVEIRLNRAHPCYDQLKIDSSLKESPLFLEVISSALLIIVDSVKDSLGPEWDNVMLGQGYTNGSIAEAIYYFVVKLDWDISSSAKLAQSIHKFFDDNLKGGSL